MKESSMSVFLLQENTVAMVKQREMQEIIIRHDEKLETIYQELKIGHSRFKQNEADIKCLVRFKDRFLGAVIAISFVVSLTISIITIVISLMFRN